MPSETPRRSLGRRDLLAGGLAGGIAAGAAVGGFALGRATDSADASAAVSTSARPGPSRVSPHGEHQAGVTNPAVRQAHLGITVVDVVDLATLPGLLAALGDRIGDLAAGDDPHLAGMDPADLTVTVGIGPRAVVALRGPGGPGTQDLPRFAREKIPDRHRGGDLLLQVCAGDPTVVALAEQSIARLLADQVSPRWQLAGFRGGVDGVGARNLLGFYDGISVPTTPAEHDRLVWLDAPAGMAGATIAVVRVMPIDVERFVSMPVAEQEAVIGRRRGSGVALSGGKIDDDPDLHAKSSSGEYDIALDAHVRRAHPLPAGAAGLMLRRGYSYARGADDKGLVFVSFQRELDTFARTQARMDESDALMAFTHATASGTFLILPGFTPDRPLGSGLAAT